MSVDSILSVYYRDTNYKNNYCKTPDKTAVLGKYLYGDFTIDDLDKVNTKMPYHMDLLIIMDMTAKKVLRIISLSSHIFRLIICREWPL